MPDQLVVRVDAEQAEIVDDLGEILDVAAVPVGNGRANQGFAHELGRRPAIVKAMPLTR